MNDIILPDGVRLERIPSSSSSDYMAGDDGRVYSKKYKGKSKKNINWYPLKGSNDGRGYFTSTLSLHGKVTRRKVHRFICEAFHGLPPKGKNQVRHLDGNPQNNKPENLAWGNKKENWLDQKRHGRGYEGEKHPCSKFTNFEREAIRWIVKKGIASQHQIAECLNVSYNAISYICRKDNDN